MDEFFDGFDDASDDDGSERRFEFGHVTVVAASPDAIKCRVGGRFGETFWVPRSQIDDLSEVYDSDHEGTLIVSQWFAEKRGWA
jgi:hypothetical protein